MRTSDFDFELPERLIAQTPAEPRDSARLLVYDRASGRREVRHFRDIVDYLRAGDVLVVNNTRVMRARVFGVRVREEVPTSPPQPKIEILLSKLLGEYEYEVLLKPARKLRVGDTVAVASITGTVLSKNEIEGTAVMKFDGDVEQFGEMPLPHYIKSKAGATERYQTVYADADRAGSCAAPTAGLHWTPELLARVRDMGVTVCEVLLHVGLGTFRPIKTDNILEHKMHKEYYEVSPEAIDTIARAKGEGRRVICVGTTAVRTVETVAGAILAHKDGEQSTAHLVGETDIFIYPPYKFKVVDAIITNFHLPKSTLLVLVSAFLGREKALELYQFAVKEEMRFYSFGDACLFT